MKYYFILTDSRDAWMQFVYLPTGDYVSGYIRDLQSVGISVHDYDLWTEETRPHCRAHIGAYKAEHERIKKSGGKSHPLTIT